MIALRIVALNVAFFPVLVGSSLGGPCTKQIQTIREASELRLLEIAGGGHSTVESQSAKMHRQPTPRTVELAEERLGEVSAKDVRAFREAVGRAQQADINGDVEACKKALSDAQRVLDSTPRKSP